jgi:hypothetical protein
MRSTVAVCLPRFRTRFAATLPQAFYAPEAKRFYPVNPCFRAIFRALRRHSAASALSEIVFIADMRRKRLQRHAIPPRNSARV